MKQVVQRLLQLLLGYERYLWVFTRFKLKTLRRDNNEKDFFHFLTLLPQNAITLDIGANLGLMSYFLASKSKLLFAIEPMPNNLNNLYKLKKHFKLDSLRILNYAVGNKNTEIELVLPIVKGVKKQGLSHVVDPKMEEFNEGKIVKAQCYKLDDLSEIHNLKVDAIKIDVENFEYEVFKGAEKTLREHLPMIYCELWNNQNRIDCFNYLKGLGYSIHVLQGGDLVEEKGNPSDIQNFFFLPPHR